jgi:hypothetical protein
MRRLMGLLALVVVAAPGAGTRLVAQAQVFGADPKLDPMRQSLKADILVLRDTLYAVDAVSARLVRAKVGHSPSVVVASARNLRVECTRATRATAMMHTRMAAIGTNDPRGKAVIGDYIRGLVELEAAMKGCDKSLEAALAAPKAPTQEPLFRAALAAQDAIKKYDWKLSVMLKTLQIPVDPKGFKSAINL